MGDQPLACPAFVLHQDCYEFEDRYESELVGEAEHFPVDPPLVGSVAQGRVADDYAIEGIERSKGVIDHFADQSGHARETGRD